MLTIDTPTEWMFLPDDGKEAERLFLSLLKSPGETWISAYGFTLQPMFDEILAADAAGVKIHILLDHTQSAGTAEAPKVKNLCARMVNGDVTITTAGCDSGSASAIWHEKAMVVTASDGGDDYCWQGSINFSESGWDQGNTGSLFRSSAWAAQMTANFEEHRLWARVNHPQWQNGPQAKATAGPTVQVQAGDTAVVTGPASIVPTPGGTS